jgi:hypothetical protein
VRSDEDDAAKRWHEERGWLDALASDAHPAAEGLRLLGAERVSTRLLRADRPHNVLTDARFARVDRVIERSFEALGLRGEATLEADGPIAVLSISLDLSSDIIDNGTAATLQPIPDESVRADGVLKLRLEWSAVR